MGQFALPSVIGLLASGTATSAVGAYRQGEAGRQSARFNRRVNAIQTGQQLEQMVTGQRRQRAENVTRVAKSGVRLTGSPLAVLANNEYLAEKQRQRVQYAGTLRDELYRMSGRSSRAAGRVGIASEVIGGAGRIGSLAVRNA